MTTLTRANVGEELVRALPELQAAIESDPDVVDEVGPLWMVEFANTLHPMMMSALANHDERNVRRVFDFLERLSGSRDDYAQALATDAVECILGSGGKRHREVAERYLGPAARVVYERARPWFREPKR